MREFATEILDSPLTTFGVGVVAGALTSGIIISVTSWSHQRKLEEQLRESVETSMRNETAARTYQEMIRELRYRERRYREELERMRVDVEASRRQAEASRRKAAQAGAVKVEDMLTGNLGQAKDAGVRTSAVKVGRAAVKTAAASVAPDKDKTHLMSTEMRSESIDHRIPRFDDSLFAEADSTVTTPVEPAAAPSRADKESGRTPGAVPPFMARAVETKTVEPEPVPVAPPMAEPAEPKVWEPREFDVKSYIDSIVEEELEESRGFDGRRFSRPPFTVWEGTGDINAMARSTYKPRHLAHAAQEA